MNISVMGAGYVGLVTSACFAEKGHQIINCDIDEERINLLNADEIPIHEPGLEDLIEIGMATHGDDVPLLRFSTNIEQAVRESGLIFITVGTPYVCDGMNLDYMWRAVKDVSEFAGSDEKILAIKSTVPVGITDKVQNFFDERNRQITVVSNPEFLVEGRAVESTKKPDRIIVGTNHLGKVREIFDDLYAPFLKRTGNLKYMRTTSAELSKLVANAYLATRISFINEMAVFAERVGADIEEVRMGAGSDARIGLHYFFPGLGYGGSCFPKDVPTLIDLMDEVGMEAYVLMGTHARNKEQKSVMPTKVLERFGGNVGNLTFGLWGLAFKANTDDIRESPALEIVRVLTDNGAKIKAYDPQAVENTMEHFKNLIDAGRLEMSSGQYEATEGVSGLVIATEWDVFASPNFPRLMEVMKKPIIFDGRNLLDPKTTVNAGFEYHSIGRRAIKPEHR